MSQPEIDERKGLPSASSALENSLCHGRWQAQQLFAKLTAEPIVDADDSQPEEESEEDAGAEQEGTEMDKDAAAGRRIHLLYAGANCPDSNDQEVSRAEQARGVDRKILGMWEQSLPDEPDAFMQEIRERRWWLRDSDGQELYSGQTDVVWVRGVPGGEADVLVGDLKGLWGKHDPAKVNCQIRHYIALVAHGISELGFSAVRSAWGYLNQPAKTLDPAPVIYDRDALNQACFEMWMEVMAITASDATRTPGPIQCHRCRAKLICEEYNTVQEITVAELPIVAPGLDKKEIAQRIEVLTPDKLGQLLRWGPTFKNAAELAIAEAKRRLRADPASLPGWKIKKNAPREKVINVQLVYQRLAEKYGIEPGDFTALCSITKKAVTATVRAKSDLKGQKLEEAAEAIFEGATKANPVSDGLEESE